jgi:hypothetical protein
MRTAMKTRYMPLAILMILAGAGAALASEAETSATASNGRHRSGTAAATARYQGALGFARTDARTGRVNVARGVAVGVDRNGVSLSVSTALAPKIGPALATSFNLSINRKGEVARSVGIASARGGQQRSVTVSGGTHSGSRYRSSSAISRASGKTRHGGMVKVNTRSDHKSRRPLLRRILRGR